jgi:hypothetical protein
MKKIIFFAILGAFSLNFISCEEENEKEGNNVVITPVENLYTGTINVEFRGQNNATEGIDCGVSKDDNKKTIDLSLYQVKFVPQMPMTIDLTIPEITFQDSDNGIKFSADSIAPTMGGNPYPDYAAKNLTGMIMGDSIWFHCSFGDYPTTYQGNLK